MKCEHPILNPDDSCHTCNASASQVAADDQAQVDEVRENAIDQADNAVTDDWKSHAHGVITLTARDLEELTSEDVWDHGLRPPDTGSADGDALGPAMRRAAAAGIIVSTGKLESHTRRPQRHNNPKRVWKSLIYEDS